MIEKKQIKKRRRTLAELFRKSATVNKVSRFTLSLYKLVINSVFGAVMTCYGKISEKLENSFFASAFKKKHTDENYRSVRHKISNLYETSFFSKVLDTVKAGILSCPVSTLGIAFFAFGFYSTIIMLFRRFAFSFTPIPFVSFVTSIILMVVSVIMFFSKKTFTDMINDSKILDFLLFDFLALRKSYDKTAERHSRLSAGIMVVIGLLLGTLTMFVSPFKVVMAVIAFVGCLVVLNSPESGIIAIIISLPFLRTKYLILMVLITELSYVLKCIRRKRVIKISVTDIFVTAFAVLVVSGGVISVDAVSSIPKMLVFTVFLLTYFVVKNLFRSEKLIMRCIQSITASAVVVSLIGIFQYFFGSVSTKWLDTSMFADIKGRAVSTFENPNVLGEFLIIAAPIIFAMVIFTSVPRKKFAFFMSFLVCSACLIFTWSRGAWLGFAAAAIIFIIMSSHRSLSYFIISIPAIALLALLIMDTSVAGRAMSIGNTSDSSTLYRLNIWLGSLKMLSEKWFYGIGIGTEAFSSVYPRYSYAGVEVAPHTHSLYLQITAETGIFSLLIFIAFIFMMSSMVFSYMKRSSNRKHKILTLGILCGIFAFLVQGMTDYVWYNYRIYLLFWLVAGLLVAAASSFKEKEEQPLIYM